MTARESRLRLCGLHCQMCVEQYLDECTFLWLQHALQKQSMFIECFKFHYYFSYFLVLGVSFLMLVYELAHLLVTSLIQ